jgi:hypothetical protein
MDVARAEFDGARKKGVEVHDTLVFGSLRPVL